MLILDVSVERLLVLHGSAHVDQQLDLQTLYNLPFPRRKPLVRDVGTRVGTLERPSGRQLSVTLEGGRQLPTAEASWLGMQRREDVIAGVEPTGIDWLDRSLAGPVPAWPAERVSIHQSLTVDSMTVIGGRQGTVA